MSERERERERERAGGHWKPFDFNTNCSFLCKATARRYIRKPTNTASKGTSSRLKEVLLQSVVQKKRFFQQLLDWVVIHSTAKLDLVTPIWHYFHYCGK